MCINGVITGTKSNEKLTSGKRSFMPIQLNSFQRTTVGDGGKLSTSCQAGRIQSPVLAYIGMANS
jgi:hypothetical protein